MDLSLLEQLDAEQIRVLVPQFLSGFIDHPEASASNLKRVGLLFENRSDRELKGMLRTVQTVGADHVLYRANPLCRELLRSWTRDVLPEHSLTGVEHLATAMDAGPTILLGNHLSYYDTGALDVVLAWNGHSALSDRIVAAAGPKVYEHVFRRFAAASLNTLPVPQSNSFEHTAELSPRELARKAKASVESAHDAIRQGYALLVYAEGSRSRTGRLRPFLKAVHRYLGVKGARIVPTAVTGTEAMFPVGTDNIVPASVSVAFGPSLAVDELGGTKAALQLSWHALAELLPEPYQPDPADGVWEGATLDGIG